jgi:hypothetical protein
MCKIHAVLLYIKVHGSRGHITLQPTGENGEIKIFMPH